MGYCRVLVEFITTRDARKLNFLLISAKSLNAHVIPLLLKATVVEVPPVAFKLHDEIEALAYVHLNLKHWQ
jgi:hypothetical protein